VRVIGAIELAQFVVLVGVLFLFTLAVSVALAVIVDYWRNG
jgi:hypothetical protein